ncbi:MATE family efflux transporter [bacterium]|nr:MATE family efflux transporter [bacterium]
MEQVEQPGLAVAEPSIIVPGVAAGSMAEAWRLAYPTVIGMFSATLMWTVDTILLGHVGKVPLAAAGFGGVLVWTLYTFFVGTVQGVNTFVAQAKGAGRPHDCALFAWQGLWVAVGATGLLALLYWQMPRILALAGPEAAVEAECLRYVRARMLGAPFLLATFAFHSFFRGVGDMKTPMVIVIIANLLNIGLDLLLIFGAGPVPALGTLGAGLATSASDFSAALMGLALFLRPAVNAIYGSARRAAAAFQPAPLLRLLRVGAPIGGQFFLDMGSFTIFMAIMGRLGTDELAASQIGIQLLSFSFMPANGISKAATTMVGQYLGAGRAALAARCGWVTLRMNLIYSLVVAVVFLVARRHLFTLFNDDPGVVAAGLAIVPLLAIFQILDAVQMTFSNALQGAGDTRFPLLVILLGSYVVFLPLALLLAYRLELGIVGGWLGEVVAFGLIASLLTWRFRAGRWQSLRV